MLVRAARAGWGGSLTFSSRLIWWSKLSLVGVFTRLKPSSDTCSHINENIPQHSASSICLHPLDERSSLMQEQNQMKMRDSSKFQSQFRENWIFAFFSFSSWIWIKLRLFKSRLFPCEKWRLRRKTPRLQRLPSASPSRMTARKMMNSNNPLRQRWRAKHTVSQMLSMIVHVSCHFYGDTVSQVVP